MDEREANTIPKGPRWLWDWKWWVAIVGIGILWTILRMMNGTLS